MEKLFDIGDVISRFFASQIGFDIASYCRLEAALDNETFITNEGGLCSFLALRGVRGYADNDESQVSLTGVFNSMRTALRNGDHTFHIMFTQDPDVAYEYVRESMEPTYATLRRLRLDSLSDLLDSDAEAMANQISAEWCIVAIITHPSVLSKNDTKRSAMERSEYIQKNNVPLLLNSQNPFMIEMDLCNPHSALTNSFVRDLSVRGVLVHPLDTTEALRAVRKELDPAMTSNQWKPSLITDMIRAGKLSPRRSATKAGDASELLPMPIPLQLTAFDHEIIRGTKLAGGDVVRIGHRYFTPIVVEEAPENVEHFDALLSRVNGNLPFRVSYEIRRGGMESDQAKQIFLAVFGWMGQANRDIKAAYDDLNVRKKNGEIIVNLRIIFVTWADDIESLARRQAVLTKIIQSWGAPQVTSNVGDSYAGVTSSIPGFGRISSAIGVPAPLSEVIRMLPILRPASPWPVGSSFNFCSAGKIFPMQVGSKLQDTWNDAFYAPPGSGKSVTMNCLNLAGLMAPGLTELPPMLILDVGPSASGIILLLKSALPDDRKHLVSYIKLRMSSEYTINPFDTLPGCREPIPEQRETLRELLLFLLTGESSGDEPPIPPPAMSDKLASALVDEIYREFADTGRPKLYQEHRSPEVDAALDRWNLRPKGEISWWRIADRLMEAGDEYCSSLAQRFAVPDFNDCIKVLRNPAIQDLFNKLDDQIRTESTQTLVSAFQVAISSAIREYPVLQGPTRFDLGEARVVVFDLNEVRHSKRQTGLMYLLTMTAGVRRFYAKESELDIMTRSAPEIYYNVHLRMAKTYGEELKAIAFDEFHNTGGAPAIRAAVRVIQREGRKWGIRTTLSSQLLDDFDEQMIALMSSIYIMKLGNYREVQKAKSLFNLSDDVGEAMFRSLNGPPRMFAYFLTKQGRFMQFLENRPGVVKLWALTTDQDEMSLRDRMYRVMSQQDARRVLSRRFPTPGAAAGEILRRRKDMRGEEGESVIADLAKELEDGWRRGFFNDR